MTAESYDAQPYVSWAHPLTHPRFAAAAARLYGVQAPPVERCRVLEFGCAHGSNLIPMAVGEPGSCFVGVDYSRRQIEQARATVAQLGLQNIEFLFQSITDIGPELGEFDYIIAQGVYSWVPPEVRDCLLALCARHLGAGGLAYISYNTYPGWHQKEVVRDMMLFHAHDTAEPVERAARARDLIDFMAGAVPGKDNAYGIMLRQQQAHLAHMEDAYILHDYMETVNAPVYFHRFLEEASAHGLTHVADARRLTVQPDDFPPDTARTLQAYCRTADDLEQYADFLSNQSFRASLLCHSGARVHQRPGPAEAAGLYAVSFATPAGDGRDGGFHGAGGAHYVEHFPPARAAMERLCAVSPRAVRVDELTAAEPDAQAGERVVRHLMRAGRLGLIEFCVRPPAFEPQVSERPMASPLVRLQARMSGTVTSLWHMNIGINPFSRRLLQYLDGRHDRAQLLRRMEELWANGTIRDTGDEAGPLPQAEVSHRLAAEIDGALAFLARAAVLIA